MSGQDANAMRMLNQSVEDTKLSLSMLNKSPSQIAKEGFPKFSQLPFEIRSMIWKEAMPPYGFYTVLMLGREEPMPQQPPAPAPMRFRAVYRLEPVPSDQQDHKLQKRLATMRAIQRVSTEAASEVEIAFPTTIDCTGGKLRFNAVHDTLSLSDLQYYLGSSFLYRFARYTHGSIVFKDDWHKIPRAMMFNNAMLWRAFNILSPWFSFPGPTQFLALEGFMTFLADCTNLRIMGFMYDTGCDYLSYFNEDYLALLSCRYQCPKSCCFAPIMRGSFYRRHWQRPSSWSVQYLIEGVRGLEALIGGLPPGEQVPTGPQAMRFGRQELQHLRIQAALPVSNELLDKLYDKICGELESRKSKEARNGGTGSS